MNRVVRKRRGFTLLEIIIVSALISLLSGIAIFSITQFYSSNLKKITIGEARQLATALSIAEQQVQFYPKFHLLNVTSQRVLVNSAGTGYGAAGVIPGIDYFGFITGGASLLSRIEESWDGPFMGMSASRVGQNRGASGIVIVRLSDQALDGTIIGGQDASLVPWPSDVWGNPYVLYQLKAFTAPSGLPFFEFTVRESEPADFLSAVVSYGPNGIPGGNINTQAQYAQSTLEPGSLWVVGDVTGGDADFTMKSSTASDPNLRLENFTPQQQFVFDSLRGGRTLNQEPTDAEVEDGEVGIIDRTSDDVIAPIG